MRSAGPGSQTACTLSSLPGSRLVCAPTRAAPAPARPICSCASSSSRALRGLQRPVSRSPSGMNRSWPKKQIHHQVCHWPGLSFCGLRDLRRVRVQVGEIRRRDRRDRLQPRGALPGPSVRCRQERQVRGRNLAECLQPGDRRAGGIPSLTAISPTAAFCTPGRSGCWPGRAWSRAIAAAVASSAGTVAPSVAVFATVATGRPDSSETACACAAWSFGLRVQRRRAWPGRPSAAP